MREFVTYLIGGVESGAGHVRTRDSLDLLNAREPLLIQQLVKVNWNSFNRLATITHCHNSQLPADKYPIQIQIYPLELIISTNITAPKCE
jgi:hypothetical protein